MHTLIKPIEPPPRGRENIAFTDQSITVKIDMFGDYDVHPKFITDAKN